MILNLAVIFFLVVFIGIWGRHAKGYGALSSFLAMVCVVAAGAIALALWEPLAYGVFLGLHEDSGWALALIVPFIVSLVILRLIVDTAVKANISVDEVSGFVIGGICALVSGTIVTGFFVLSIGFLRFPPTVLMYTAVEDQRDGNLVYAHRLWVPVDLATVKLYESLSLGSFDVAQPLAANHPDLHVQAAMLRETFEGKTRNAVQPEDFIVKGHYTLESTLDSSGSILQDSYGGKAQTVVYPDGEEPGIGATLHGFLVEFQASAREAGGSIIVTPGQLRLVCQYTTASGAPDESRAAEAVQPFAVIARPAGASQDIVRFRLNASDSVISSVGGGEKAGFGFEFVAPAGTVPTYLLVKNVRIPVDEIPGETLVIPDFEGRDAMVDDRTLFTEFDMGAGAGLDLDESGKELIAVDRGQAQGIRASRNLPGRYQLNRSERGSLEVSDDNEIVRGSLEILTANLNQRIDRSLAVDKFITTKDTGIIQVEMAETGAQSLFGKALRAAENLAQPLLVDGNGQTYPAVGYFYDDGTTTQIRFDPANPIRTAGDLPQLSDIKPNQTLWVIFMPTKNVEIKKFVIGNKVIAEFEGGGVEVR